MNMHRHPEPRTADQRAVQRAARDRRRRLARRTLRELARAQAQAATALGLLDRYLSH